MRCEMTCQFNQSGWSSRSLSLNNEPGAGTGRWGCSSAGLGVASTADVERFCCWPTAVARDWRCFNAMPPSRSLLMNPMRPNDANAPLSADKSPRPSCSRGARSCHRARWSRRMRRSCGPWSRGRSSGRRRSLTQGADRPRAGGEWRGARPFPPFTCPTMASPGYKS